MKPFNYLEPKTVKEACRLLKEHGDKARIIAGGTDLVIQMKRGNIAPEYVINLKRIDELRTITESNDGFSIGAAATLTEVAEHQGILKKLPMVSSAALSVGSSQVRNRASIGGNICNAAPSADMAPGLLVLGTVLTISGPDGDRELPISSFFTGPGTIALDSNEIVSQLFVPQQAEYLQMIYIKHGPRQAMDCSVVGVAMCLEADPTTQAYQDVRIALGAVAPTPVRAVATEKLILGKTAAELDLDAIEALVRTEASPITDVRASADYRFEMVSVLTTRAIEILNSPRKES